ncbi:microsomal glutathione S-transferase 1-like isoform X2 [Diabrotica virgifera virgifera]|uniref:Microsomal glutathione S-transferase 1 n=1 Tax=Diabrotica virgifera virgifera TaxID=50390 RepID=A0A6P7G3P0_DIAVI|nr:microsomal glutathione S-transferase 1-like isoform X2 [Diabrotica virgifera virgifera]
MNTEKLYLPIKRELLEFYVFWVAILVFKYLLMIAQVGLSRVYFRVPLNEEDGKVLKAAVRAHEAVDRNRRAHLNDLENIPFFIIISFLYLLTDPSVGSTKLIIRIYVLSRILYTFTYTILKSAIRIPMFQLGILINGYLTIKVIYHFS